MVIHRLDACQVEAFFEIGFVTVAGVFSRREVEEMRAAFDRLQAIAERLRTTQMHRGSLFVMGTGGEDLPPARPAIQRIVWCGAAEPVLSRYGRDRRLLEMAAGLLGSREMNQLINQAHFRLPGDGVAFPWHQDSTHRRYGGSEWRDVNGTGSYVQTVTALDDIIEDNGPLRFLPGTGRLGHLDLPTGGTLPAGLDVSCAVSALMEAGSVLLFGPYLLHMSAANRSDRPRRAFLNGFACPGANRRIYPGTGAGRLVRID